MIYHFKSKVGVFWIRPQPNAPGRYWLGINDTTLGSYASPMQAADDVYCHATGLSDWDMLGSSAGDPSDISEWQH